MPAEHKPTVLLVDDEPDILNSLAHYLRIALPGTLILTAANAEAALPIAKKEEIDVVVSDLKMPGMDGIELLRKLRGCFPKMRRILITAFHEPELEQRAADAGVGTLLWKPFEMAELRTVVGRALKSP